MRGDRVLVLVDVGAAEPREFEVAATKAGRTVEVATPRGGLVEVSEVGRTGQIVRTDRFMASRVIALTEHRTEPDDVPDSLPGLS